MYRQRRPGQRGTTALKVVLLAFVLAAALALSNSAAAVQRLTGVGSGGRGGGGSGSAASSSPRYHDAEYQRDIEEFHRFAAARSCKVGSPQYDMIAENLSGYEASGITEGMLAAGFQRCRDTLLVEIRNRTLAATTLKEGSTQEGAMRQHWYNTYFSRLAPHLPDTKIVVNMMDEPCSWTAPLPPEAEVDLASGALGFEDAWLRHGCDSVGLQRLRQLHGFFVAPSTFPATRERAPVWSSYSIPGCFGDILGPNNGVWAEQPRVCPPPGTPKLADKIQTAIFRGSTSGGAAMEGQTEEHYSRFHRPRLVEHTRRLNRSDIDAGIVGYVQCSPANCAAMQERYGLAPRIAENDIFGYAYHLLVDGNGALNRLARYLCSGSLALLGCVMQEWYFRGLKPYEHYLPLDIDYSNLEALVDWAKGHPREAEAIAARGAAYAGEQLRNEDMDCYTVALAAEYNRLRRKAAAAGAAGGAAEGTTATPKVK